MNLVRGSGTFSYLLKRSCGESQRKNRPDFVLEAARVAAEEALSEQRIIMADPDTYQEFLARLDQTPAPWEQKNDIRP